MNSYETYCMFIFCVKKTKLQEQIQDNLRNRGGINRLELKCESPGDLQKQIALVDCVLAHQNLVFGETTLTSLGIVI